MSFRRFIILAALYLCTGTIIPCSYGQKEITDSIDMSRAGKNAISDVLFFDALKAKMHNDDKLAKESLEQFVAIRPEVSVAWYELSRISYGDRKLDKAEEYIKKAISLNPENKWYKEEYASLLADRGTYTDAASVVAELCKSYPGDANYPLIAAEYYSKAKKYADAITYLDKALVRHGEDEEILMRKVQAYLNMNEVEKAADILKRLIAKEPKSGRYYRMLGDLYDNNKMPAKAAEVYEHALKIIPDDPTIQLGIAENYLKAGDTAAYITHVKKVIINKDVDVETQLAMLNEYLLTLPNDSVIGAQGLPIISQLVAQHPDDADVLLLFGKFLDNSNQHDSATLAYKKALRIKPNSAELWNRLLRGYTDKKFADSLIKNSEKAMRLFPSVAIYSYFNSIGYLNKKQYPQALNAINRAIDLQPENDKQMLAEMYAIQADIYHSNKQDELSDKAFEKALELNPDNATVLNNYSYYLSERGKKLDEAERMSQKSLELMPNYGTFLDTYGWIQYKKGNYLKAKDFIERAIKLAGANIDATLYDHLGNICYQLNEKDKAIEYWKKAKESGADDPLIDKKISEGKLYE